MDNLSKINQLAPSSASAPPLAEAEVLAALRDCYDPAFALNIVALGMVQSIDLAPDPTAPGSGIPGVPARHRVSIALILAAPESDTEAESQLPAIIRNRLAAFETISRTEVEILQQPAWTPDRISPEGRIQLAAHLTARRPADDLVQINVQIDAQTKT